MDKDRLKDLTVRGIGIFQESRMSVYSGYATLFIVTAVFPCVILILSIVNLLPGYSAKDVAELLFRILPDLGPVKLFVTTLLSDLKAQSGGLLASAAAATTLWSASKGVMAIQNGLDQLDSRVLSAEQKEKEGGLKGGLIDTAKAVLKRLLFTLMLIVLIPALMVFQMLSESIVDIIRSSLEKLDMRIMDKVLQNLDSFFYIGSLLVVLLAFVVVLLMYAYLPKVKRPPKSQVPGALFTCVCWFAFTELFSFFIPRFYHASNVYGSLASLFLVLLWLRYMVMILFGGGTLNHVLEEERQDK